MKTKLFFIFSTFILLYFGVIFLHVFYSPLTYNEIDLNNNGFVDFSEALYGGELGERNITLGHKSCIEYYHLKDGMPAKIDCNK